MKKISYQKFYQYCLQVLEIETTVFECFIRNIQRTSVTFKCLRRIGLLSTATSGCHIKSFGVRRRDRKSECNDGWG